MKINIEEYSDEEDEDYVLEQDPLYKEEKHK